LATQLGGNATFQDRLVKPIILACRDAGDLVLDPFARSGTTCRIAKEKGRHYLGIELNPEYAAMAARAVGLHVESVPLNA
jgi:DNA modification methylase